MTQEHSLTMTYGNSTDRTVLFFEKKGQEKELADYFNNDFQFCLDEFLKDCRK